jgi:hypothetical protein
MVMDTVHTYIVRGHAQITRHQDWKSDGQTVVGERRRLRDNHSDDESEAIVLVIMALICSRNPIRIGLITSSVASFVELQSTGPFLSWFYLIVTVAVILLRLLPISKRVSSC